VQLYTDLWLSEVLLPHDNRVAAGLGYHLCDVLLPELAAVCSSGGGGSPLQEHTLLALLEPFCQALARTRDPALIYRLRWVELGGTKAQPAAGHWQGSLHLGCQISLQDGSSGRLICCPYPARSPAPPGQALCKQPGHPATYAARPTACLHTRLAKKQRPPMNEMSWPLVTARHSTAAVLVSAVTHLDL
jgi:hypothetical protein